MSNNKLASLQVSDKSQAAESHIQPCQEKNGKRTFDS